MPYLPHVLCGLHGGHAGILYSPLLENPYRISMFSTHGWISTSHSIGRVQCRTEKRAQESTYTLLLSTTKALLLCKLVVHTAALADSCINEACLV